MSKRRVVLLGLSLIACQDDHLPPFHGTDLVSPEDAAPTEVRNLDASTLDAGALPDAAKPKEDAAPDPFEMPVTCTSKMMRGISESEGADMMPGYACISCHLESNAADQDDAPIFALAGTVYSSGHEPDTCLSPQAEGARIIVLDAANITHTVEVGASGNFQLEDVVVVPPYQAKVVFQGRERAMGLPQVSGDCNSCHTSQGDNPDPKGPKAPGRIVLP